MSTLRLLISDSYDPWFNLAVEECIFRQMPATQRVLFLWRNADTVVIGRAQNPWKECNTRRMEEDNVRLARRSSGGGAVFHDLGNTCFTFMAGKPEYDKTISTSIVLNALNALGVSAEASGRNDLVVKTARVAGNGTSVRLRHSRICWMNALPGAAWNCISTLKKAISPAPRCLPTVSTPRRWKPSPGDCKAVCTARICCNRSAKRCWLTSRNRKKSYGSCQRGWQGR